MKPTTGSTPTDVYNVKDDDGNVEVYHDQEQEYFQGEENPDDDINASHLPSTIDLSDQGEPTEIILMDRNNNWQQQSPYKQIIRPAPIPGNEKSGHNRPGLKTGTRRMICHSCYEDGHETPDCTLKFRDNRTIILNYEKINAEDKTRVTSTSYNQEVRLVKAGNESKLATQVKQTDQKSL